MNRIPLIPSASIPVCESPAPHSGFGDRRDRRSNLKLISMAMCITLGIVTSVRALAASSDDQPCSKYENEFTASRVVRAAEIIGRTGDRVHIFKVHPDSCGSGSAPQCKSKAYLIPGDVVDKGASCKGFSHVRYHANTRDYIGWVSDGAVEELGSTPASTETASSIEGYYTSSNWCSGKSDGGFKGLCHSCLLINKIGEIRIAFYLHAISYGKECGAAGIVDFNRSKLVFIKPETGGRDDGRGIEISIMGPDISFRYLSKGEYGSLDSRSNEAFCSGGASLVGLRFSKAGKQSATGKLCD